MRYRLFGRTGLYVSELCFGAMTFGGKGFWEVVGKTPQDEADRLVGVALDAGRQLLRHRGRLLRGGVREDPRQGAGPASQATSCSRPRCAGASGPGREPARTVAAAHPRVDRRQPQAPRHRLGRPLSDPRRRRGDAARRDPARARRRRALRQGPLRRVLEPRGVAARQGQRARGEARLGALRVAAGLLHDRRARSRARARAAAQGPADGAHGLEPAGRGTPQRQVLARRQGARRDAARELRLPAGRTRSAPSTASTR